MVIETAHTMLALRFPGVAAGYFLKNFCIAFFEFVRNVFSNTCLVFDIAVQVCDCILWCLGVSSEQSR